jgi:hypothetical protein
MKDQRNVPFLHALRIDVVLIVLTEPESNEHSESLTLDVADRNGVKKCKNRRNLEKVIKHIN